MEHDEQYGVNLKIMRMVYSPLEDFVTAITVSEATSEIVMVKLWGANYFDEESGVYHEDCEALNGEITIVLADA